MNMKTLMILSKSLPEEMIIKGLTEATERFNNAQNDDALKEAKDNLLIWSTMYVTSQMTEDMSLKQVVEHQEKVEKITEKFKEDNGKS